MKCNKIIERFLKLDNKPLPFYIHLHIKSCEKCGNEINRLKNELNNLQDFSSFGSNVDLSNEIMNKIYASELIYSKNVSSFKWIAVGLFILLSIFLLPFNNSLNSMRMYFGTNLELPLSIVMGLVISIYSSLFIATHLDEIKKITHYNNNKFVNKN